MPVKSPMFTRHFCIFPSKVKPAVSCPLTAAAKTWSTQGLWPEPAFYLKNRINRVGGVDRHPAANCFCGHLKYKNFHPLEKIFLPARLPADFLRGWSGGLFWDCRFKLKLLQKKCVSSGSAATAATRNHLFKNPRQWLVSLKSLNPLLRWLRIAAVLFHCRRFCRRQGRQFNAW